MSRLYLLDDHIIMRECLHALLEAGGHTVVGESADPTEALAELRHLCPDVLLLDLHLGERSGFELLAALQHCELSTRSVVLTSSAQPHHIAEALRMGARGYVRKECASSELLSAIETVMLGKRHMDSEVAQLALQGLAQPMNDNPLHALSPRERQIILMVVNGQSSTEIGLELMLSPKSVATYRSRLMAKLGVRDVSSLVKLAIEVKLIDSDNP